MIDKKHLYLVDGSGYIFRAYHRLPPLTNKRGEPVGAVYGFTTMLWKLVTALHKAEGPTHLAVIFDASKKSFRNDLYDQYKAHRPPAPEDLVPQFPLIREATRAFSVPCIEQENYEADDIIASYAKAALKKGWDVTIVSSDKDLMQMIEPGLDMYDSMNDRRLDRDHVIEKFGVPPEKLGEVLALMGDTADNVPGVPGIGPKTAAQLISAYGDLETLLANVDSITKPKLKQSLIEHAEKARLSRQLVRLESDIPLPEPLDDLILKGLPDGPLRAFLEDQGFRSLLGRLGRTEEAPAAAPAQPAEAARFNREDYETVTTLSRLEVWIAEARDKGLVAIDTETDNLDATRARLVGFSLATEAGRACYVPLGHEVGEGLLAERPQQVDRAAALALLKGLCADPAVLKIGQNLKYDLVVLRGLGIDIRPYDDTMLLSYALDAGKHGHGMDYLSDHHLGHTTLAYKDICGTGKSQIPFSQVPLDKATAYAAEDADVTLRLWQHLKPRLCAERATRVYEMVDRPLVAVIAEMEQAGIKVDRARLKQLSADYATAIAALEREIQDIAGTPFTIGSPKQLGEVLFEKMGLKGGRKGKTGTYSTDVNELERLAAEGVEIARKVLDWRQLTKLKSTYADALQEQIHPETGRVHTSFSLAVAQTGRLSSTDPNLQNIPIRTEMGRQIREAFVAEPGYVLLSADYSQIELRLAAHMADVPALKAAFAQDQDIHNLTAVELFGDASRDNRAKAKTINFAILYGISSWGLASRLGVSREEGQAIIDRYFDRFPGIRRYIAETLAALREQGFVTTLFGRKTHLPGIASKIASERQAAERQAINAPIQGTSADIIKRAMTRMGPALQAAGLDGTRMLLQVHDELVFEVPKGDAERAATIIRSVMAQAAAPAVALDVPLGVEIGFGANWDQAH